MKENFNTRHYGWAYSTSMTPETVYVENVDFIEIRCIW